MANDHYPVRAALCAGFFHLQEPVQAQASDVVSQTENANVTLLCCLQLRASYSQKPFATPGRTPSQWTQRQDLTPVLRPAAIIHPSVEAPQIAAEITDDLLDL